MGVITDIKFSSTNILIPDGYTKTDVIAWLKGEAETVLTERVARYAGIMGATYSSVKLSEAKARWGACQSKVQYCLVRRSSLKMVTVFIKQHTIIMTLLM